MRARNARSGAERAMREVIGPALAPRTPKALCDSLRTVGRLWLKGRTEAKLRLLVRIPDSHGEGLRSIR